VERPETSCTAVKKRGFLASNQEVVGSNPSGRATCREAAGAFAVLVEGQTILPGGLTVEVLDEDGLQAEVSLFRIPPWAFEAQVRAKLLGGTVLLPKDTLVTVNLQPDGTLGNATSPRRYRPEPPTRH